jgi:pimeloyl-[acyl-carrier protein] synthase
MTKTLEKDSSYLIDNALLDPLMDENHEFLQDPYPLFEKYRAIGPIAWSSRGNQWLVTGLEEANQIVRDNRFGKNMSLWENPNLITRMLFKFLRARSAGNLLFQDPPEHTRLRGLMQTAFLPGTIHAMQTHIQEITDRLLAKIKPGDQGDLLTQLAFPLPVTVIAELLGIPAADRDQFKHWSKLVTGSLQGKVCPFKAMKSFRASRELRAYLHNVIKNKRKEPGNDLLTTLSQIQTKEDGRLSEKELLANSMLVLIAGHETTVNLISNGMYHLLKNKEQHELLKQNPQLLEAAVEEFLRLDPPVQIVRRIAYSDITVGGTTIKSGQAVTMLIGACNRDPRVFAHPERMDIQREKFKHFSFGAGIHFCLGSELARNEARIAVATLLRKYPDMRLQEDQMSYRSPFALRGLDRLPVVY